MSSNLTAPTIDDQPRFARLGEFGPQSGFTRYRLFAGFALMDESRLSRYITPSGFFIGALVSGYWATSPAEAKQIAELLSNSWEAVVAITLASLFPLGFLLMSIAKGVERLIARSFSFELDCSDACFGETAWQRLALILKFSDWTKLRGISAFAAQFFHDEIIPDESRQSLIRLWSAYNIARNSAVGVHSAILALAIFWLSRGIVVSVPWVFGALFIAGALHWSGQVAWSRHMEQFKFHILRTEVTAGEIETSENRQNLSH